MKFSLYLKNDGRRLKSLYLLVYAGEGAKSLVI